MLARDCGLQKKFRNGQARHRTPVHSAAPDTAAATRDQGRDACRRIVNVRVGTGDRRAGCSLPAGVQAVLYRVPDQVNPVVQLQLVQRVLNMVLYGAVG